MLRQIVPALAGMLLISLATSLASAQEILRGTLKKIDIEKRMILVTSGGRDLALPLTDDIQVPGGNGRSLIEKLVGFKEGSEVIFRTVDRGGGLAVQGIRLAESHSGIQTRVPGGQDARRGKVKVVDWLGRSIVLTVTEGDLVLTVTEHSNIQGVRGDSLAERVKGLESGTDVFFFAETRDGHNFLIRLAPTGKVHGGTRPGSGGQQPVVDLASLVALDEEGGGSFMGYALGLYPDGKSARPEEHEAEGLKLAGRIQPLDAVGRPDPAGRIVLLSLGMSNASQAWQGFQRGLVSYAQKNSRLLVVDGAQANMTAAAVQDPNSEGRGKEYWAVVDRRLNEAGATRAQVQAIWIKYANFGPRERFPAYAKQLQADLKRIVQLIPSRFPNAKLAYLSSRSYAGYSSSTINPEPFAYESGFAVKWLIEEQLRHDPSLNFNVAKGAVKAPWLSWGPYWWANGQSRQSSGGPRLVQADFALDGTHLSAAGQRKTGQMLLDFFKSDATTRTWFNQRQASSLSSSILARHTLPSVSDPLLGASGIVERATLHR